MVEFAAYNIILDHHISNAVFVRAGFKRMELVAFVTYLFDIRTVLSRYKPESPVSLKVHLYPHCFFCGRHRRVRETENEGEDT